MRKQRITYFISGLVLQLSIVTVMVYWFTLVSKTNLQEAVNHFATKLPSYMQDTTVVMIVIAAFTIISMLCYAASRNYSLSRSFRTLTMGLILIDAIILLWLILSLM